MANNKDSVRHVQGGNRSLKMPASANHQQVYKKWKFKERCLFVFRIPKFVSRQNIFSKRQI